MICSWCRCNLTSAKNPFEICPLLTILRNVGKYCTCESHFSYHIKWYSKHPSKNLFNCHVLSRRVKGQTSNGLLDIKIEPF